MKLRACRHGQALYLLFACLEPHLVVAAYGRLRQPLVRPVEAWANPATEADLLQANGPILGTAGLGAALDTGIPAVVASQGFGGVAGLGAAAPAGFVPGLGAVGLNPVSSLDALAAVEPAVEGVGNAGMANAGVAVLAAPAAEGLAVPGIGGQLLGTAALGNAAVEFQEARQFPLSGAVGNSAVEQQLARTRQQQELLQQQLQQVEQQEAQLQQLEQQQQELEEGRVREAALQQAALQQAERQRQLALERQAALQREAQQQRQAMLQRQAAIQQQAALQRQAAMAQATALQQQQQQQQQEQQLAMGNLALQREVASLEQQLQMRQQPVQRQQQTVQQSLPPLDQRRAPAALQEGLRQQEHKAFMPATQPQPVTKQPAVQRPRQQVVAAARRSGGRQHPDAFLLQRPQASLLQEPAPTQGEPQPQTEQPSLTQGASAPVAPEAGKPAEQDALPSTEKQLDASKEPISWEQHAEQLQALLQAAKEQPASAQPSQPVLLLEQPGSFTSRMHGTRSPGSPRQGQAMLQEPPVVAPGGEGLCQVSKLTVSQDRTTPVGLAFTDVQGSYGSDWLNAAQKRLVTVVPVERQSFMCLDDRITEPSLATPGGDLGEFILALSDFLQERDQSGEASPEQEVVDAFLLQYAASLPPGRRLVHCTDDRAVQRLEALLPVENLDLAAPPEHAKRAGLLSRLTEVENHGDSHIRLMLKQPEWYQLHKLLVPMVLRSFYTLLWRQNQDASSVLHAAPKLGLKVLGGASNPQAFLQVRSAQLCHGNGVAPMLAPRPQADKAVFVSHIDAVSLRRRELATFFSRIANTSPRKLDVEKMHQRLDRHGWLALETTGTRLASNLPFYTLAYT